MAYREATLPVANGGTGQVTLTNHGVLLGQGTSAVAATAVGATGTVLIGNTSADPSYSATPTVTSINFGGTALANYVEGTWTPTLDGATPGTTTYTSQNGYYTRIGNIAIVYGTVIITAATGTGDAIIGGLPFTVKNQTNGDVSGSVMVNGATWAWPASTTSISAQFLNNTLTAKIPVSGSSAATAFLQMTNGAVTIIIEGFYQI